MVRLFFLGVAVLGLVNMPARAELPPLIPRKILFGNPVRTSPQISPDGKRLAYLAPDDKDVLQVWVYSLDSKGGEGATIVTADKKRGIRQFLWTYEPSTLLYLQDDDGDENYHVYAVNVEFEETRDLTPIKKARAAPLSVDPKHPNEILVTMNADNPRVMDVVRITLKDGERKLDTKNPGDVIGWLTDPDHRVRGALAATKEGGREVRAARDEKAEFKPVVTWGPEDSDGQAFDFTADGKGLWMISSENRDTLALVKRDLTTGKDQVIAANEGADAGGFLYDDDKHEVQAVSFNRERVKWQVLDKSIADDIKAIEASGEGEPSVVSRDHEKKTWVVAFTSDVKATRDFLYDRATKKLTFLFSTQPELDKFKLAPVKPVTIKARDGLELVSYLTLPVGIEHKDLPLVLVVHGGPWARDSWGFRPESQWLANCGYAVLNVNYRGSTGFGKKFLHAGDREWAGKMHDDLLDAVGWAVKEGYVDKKRVAIYGGSYGGYAALVGATFTPDFFTRAIDIVGPSNLVTLMKSIPPYWEPMKKLFYLRVGDLEKEEEFLKSRSPLFKADKITIPLLIAQGKNDPRVKQAESEQIVEAMKKAGKPVEYMLFEDEGHGFARPENRLKFYGAAEAFLEKHLGGGRTEK